MNFEFRRFLFVCPSVQTYVDLIWFDFGGRPDSSFTKRKTKKNIIIISTNWKLNIVRVNVVALLLPFIIMIIDFITFSDSRHQCKYPKLMWTTTHSFVLLCDVLFRFILICLIFVFRLLFQCANKKLQFLFIRFFRCSPQTRWLRVCVAEWSAPLWCVNFADYFFSFILLKFDKKRIRLRKSRANIDQLPPSKHSCPAWIS